MNGHVGKYTDLGAVITEYGAESSAQQLGYGSWDTSVIQCQTESSQNKSMEKETSFCVNLQSPKEAERTANRERIDRVTSLALSIINLQPHKQIYFCELKIQI